MLTTTCAKKRTKNCLLYQYYVPPDSNKILSLGSQGRAEAQGNRNYIIEKMFADIEEIIRVLQLTTYDEDEGDDPINDMRKAASIINNKMDLAHSWLNDPNADAGGLGKTKVPLFILECSTNSFYNVFS
jgi:hypothetical protein